MTVVGTLRTSLRSLNESPAQYDDVLELIGQLVRERHGRRAVLIGFTTYTGMVTVASDWDAPVEIQRVRPALRGSYEALFNISDGNLVTEFRIQNRGRSWQADRQTP